MVPTCHIRGLVEIGGAMLHSVGVERCVDGATDPGINHIKQVTSLLPVL